MDLDLLQAAAPYLAPLFGLLGMMFFSIIASRRRFEVAVHETIIQARERRRSYVQSVRESLRSGDVHVE